MKAPDKPAPTNGPQRPRRGFASMRSRFRYAVLGLFAFSAVAWAQVSAGIRIVIIGDSTVMTYAASVYPQSGWGQELGHFFREGTVTVINRAIGGRSSRSFVEDGHWTSVRNELKSGDFLLIQFGHNDRSTVTERHADTAQYRKFLGQYITESRAKGAVPILVSPMNMNTWNGSTLREVFTEGVSDYRAAMMRVATAMDVPFIDLEKKSASLFQSLGQAYITTMYFLSLKAGEYPNYPNGITDGTHFQEMGAVAMAGLVAEGIREKAADQALAGLAGALAPLNALRVTDNKEGAGLVTLGGSYPAGAPITLKAVPNSGQTFQQWSDGAGKSVSTAKRYSFVMGAAAAEYRAMFQGGTPVGLAYPGKDGRKDRGARISAVAGTSPGRVSILANVPILDVEARDASGARDAGARPGPGAQAVELEGMPSGIHFLRIRTAEGMRILRVEGGK